jgi:hypothetical protein
MREETTTRKLYTFSELSPIARDHAIDKLWDLNVDCEWWDYNYDDAKTIGLNLTGFDTDRHDISGHFIESAESCAHLIQDNHGPDCDTTKCANNYLASRDQLIDTAPKDENGEFESERELDEKLDDLDSAFLHDILEEYLSILSKDYECLTSRESIEESIEANEYEFTEKGDLA